MMTPQNEIASEVASYTEKQIGQGAGCMATLGPFLIACATLSPLYEAKAEGGASAEDESSIVLPVTSHQAQTETLHEENIALNVESTIGRREARNYKKMLDSFQSHWKKREDARYEATFELLASRLQTLDFRSVYVDVGNTSGLITVCMSLGEGIQLDVARSVEEDSTGEVMFSFMLDGDLLVMNTIDLDNVDAMVEDIFSEIRKDETCIYTTRIA